MHQRKSSKARAFSAAVVLDVVPPEMAECRHGLIVLGIAMVVCGWLEGDDHSGQIGIALNVVLQANMYLVRLAEAWTTMESSLGAISRVRAFEKDVQPENGSSKNNQSIEAWPTQGACKYIFTVILQLCHSQLSRNL